MPTIISPILDFSIGDLTYKDLAGLENRKQAAIYAAEGRKRLRSLIAQSRSTELCDVTKVSQITRAAWEAARVLNPHITYEEFTKTFTPQLDNSDYDSRLGNISLAVWERAAFIGVFFLYNVAIISEGRNRIEVSAYPAPAIDFGDNQMWVNRILTILTTFLSQELPLSDGRVLDVVECKFPTSREDHAWTAGREAWAVDLVRSLSANSDYTVETLDGTIRSLKRAR